MIVGVALSHAQHAADKVQQVKLPPSWNSRPQIAHPLHIAFVSGDFRGHVTAHLIQVNGFTVPMHMLCFQTQGSPFLHFLIPFLSLQTAFKHFDPKRIRVSCFALTPSDNSKFRRVIESSVAEGDFHDV
jgi:hypothetical protein